MSRYLIKEHPDFYEWFSIKEFTWDRTGGDPITQGNRNPLLYKNIGADGIKTGYLAVEKFSLASSLERNGRRLIAVGSGFETKNSRSKESSKLLTYGITNFDLVEINRSDKSIDKIDVWLGKENQVEVYVKDNIYKTIKNLRVLIKLAKTNVTCRVRTCAGYPMGFQVPRLNHSAKMTNTYNPHPKSPLSKLAT